MHASAHPVTSLDGDAPAASPAGAALTHAEILAAAPVIVYVYDLAEGASAYQNRPLGELLGYDGVALEALRPGEWRTLMHPDDRRRFPAHRARLRALGVGESATWEYRMRHADGSWRWILSRDVRVLGGTGGTGVVVGSASDVTTLRLADVALRESEAALRDGQARYRSLLESMDQGFCVLEMILDDDGRPVDYRFLEVNSRFEQHTGLHDAAGRRVRELVPDLEQSWVDTYFEVARTGVPRSFAQGSAVMGRQFEVEAVRVGAPSELRVALLFRDVTERRRAEQALADAEARLRMTLDAGAIGTFSLDVATQEIVADALIRRLHGIDPDDAAMAMPADRYLASIHADDRPTVEARLAGLAAASESFAAEYRVCGTDRRWRWMQARGRVEREDGRPARLAGAVVEITALKEAEARLLEREARLEAALRVKDEFLGLVSHELRTPMTVILGMSRLLAGGQLDAAQAADVAGDIAESAEVLNELVEAMLLLARLDEGEAAQLREPVLLHRLAAEVSDALAARHPGVRFEVVPDDRALIVAVQRTWLERVVENLAGNAVKYGARQVTMVVDRDPEGMARLRVLDDGPGLGDDVDRLFEPFYRSPGSRDRAAGVGLGLAVAHRVVTVSGGRIWGRTRPEGGAEFGFVLPVATPDLID